MTQKEFTERTGLTVTEEEYKGIEQMYYAVPDMDKDEFCMLYKRVGDNALTIALAGRVRLLDGMFEERNNEAEDCHGKLNDIAEFLIGKACAHDDTDLYTQAIAILGQRAVVVYKVRMGLPLWKEDRDYIKNNLK